MLNVKPSSVQHDLGDPARSRFSPFARITALAALGDALAYFIHLLLVLVIGQMFIFPLLILGLVALVAAGLAVLGFRFASDLSALLILLVNGGDLSVPINQYIVTHPKARCLWHIPHAYVLFSLWAC